MGHFLINYIYYSPVLLLNHHKKKPLSLQHRLRTLDTKLHKCYHIDYVEYDQNAKTEILFGLLRRHAGK